MSDEADRLSPEAIAAMTPEQLAVVRADATEAQQNADESVRQFTEHFISYIGVMTADGSDRTAIMGDLYDELMNVIEEQANGLDMDRVALLLTAATYQLAEAKMDLAAVQIDGSRRGGSHD